MTRNLRTERLRLRRWRADDRAPMSEMLCDPEVMEFFPALLDRAASDALIDRMEEHHRLHGFGVWAVEDGCDGSFVGAVGLQVPAFTSFFTPCVEVAWRIGRDRWGQGYAAEAARAALSFGFEQLALEQIVSFTVEGNRRSRALMERLGMQHDPAEHFAHPLLPADHPLSRHVLYRLERPIPEDP